MNKMQNNSSYGVRVGHPYFMYDIDRNPLDKLARELGKDQLPLRSKQGVFHPKQIVVNVCSALGVAAPPSLVVQFNVHGKKRAFPLGKEPGEFA